MEVGKIRPVGRQVGSQVGTIQLVAGTRLQKIGRPMTKRSPVGLARLIHRFKGKANASQMPLLGEESNVFTIVGIASKKGSRRSLTCVQLCLPPQHRVRHHRLRHPNHHARSRFRAR